MKKSVLVLCTCVSVCQVGFSSDFRRRTDSDSLSSFSSCTHNSFAPSSSSSTPAKNSSSKKTGSGNCTSLSSIHSDSLAPSSHASTSARSSNFRITGSDSRASFSSFNSGSMCVPSSPASAFVRSVVGSSKSSIIRELTTMFSDRTGIKSGRLLDQLREYLNKNLNVKSKPSVASAYKKCSSLTAAVFDMRQSHVQLDCISNMELDDKCEIRKYYFTLKNGEFVTIKDQTVCNKLVEIQKQKTLKQVGECKSIANVKSSQIHSVQTQILLDIMRRMMTFNQSYAELVHTLQSVQTRFRMECITYTSFYSTDLCMGAKQK